MCVPNLKSLISLITALAISSAITDVTSGSVRCLSAFSVIEIHLSSVPPFFCVGWTGNGGCAACFQCLWCRCKIRGSVGPGCVRSHIVLGACEMMKVVGSATCFLESSKNRRFEFLFHCPTFSHDMIPYVLFSLRFSFILITSCQARTHCRVGTLRTAGSSRMQRFLMLSVFVSTSLSHAVELPVALAESERWERFRHVAVEAIPRINAGGLVAKRALLHCTAIVSAPAAVELSFAVSASFGSGVFFLFSFNRF